MKCFVAGTLILTATGLIAIETIKVGDKVTATNVETFERGEKSVVRTFVNNSKELVRIFVSAEEIITTPNHPFYVVDKGWVLAKNLISNEKLAINGDKFASVENILFEIQEKPVTVYNFEVADWHTYFVGESGVLVHNDCVLNKTNGIRRETAVESELKIKYPESDGYQIKREALLRDSAGKKVVDPKTGTGRRIDFIVDGNGKIVDSIEVTSMTAPKDGQMIHEANVRANGGNYVKTSDGKLLKLPEDLITRIIRRD